MSVKHSKIKNSGILFELLVRQITSDTLQGIDSSAKNILQKYFVKTELGREYKLYETISTRTKLTETKANIVLETILDSSSQLNRSILKRQKYNLIKEIKEHYDLDKFFKHKLPNYKVQAALYNLIEIKNNPQHINVEDNITNKITLLEHLSSSVLNKKQDEDILMEEFKSNDPEVRTLTYRIMLENFNKKYGVLLPPQKEILSKLILSVDNTSDLKDFYNVKINEIKNTLITLNKKTTDQIVTIKINEIVNILSPKGKNKNLKDDDLIDLLQYYELIKELKHIDEKA
jgi:hypothetical protein